MSPCNDVVLQCSIRPLRSQLRTQLSIMKTAFSLTIPTVAIALITTSLFFWTDSSPTYAETRPNIVVIVADDLGYGDVKSFGKNLCKISTPNMDRVAQQGIRFTNAYSIASVCIPSRVSMMTGQYAFRFPPAERGGPWGFVGLQFPPDQPTLASVLKESGYSTGYVGKWHLGTRMTTTQGLTQDINTVDYTKPLLTGPRDYGFDQSFILPGSLDMYPYAFIRNHRWVGDVSTVKGWSAFARMGPAAHDFRDKDVLKVIGDESIAFINDQDQTPYFLFVGLTAPHTPVSPADEFLGRSEIGVYGDFVMNTDAVIGRIANAIDQTTSQRNTLLIVTSDHGPASYAGPKRQATASQMSHLEELGHHAAGGLRGYKFSSFEGAFRVPFIARWPEKLPSDTTSNQMIGLVDLFASITHAAGIESQLPSTAHDSFSFLTPFIGQTQQGKRHSQRGSIFLQGSRGHAYRSGPWKLMLCPGSGASGRWGNTPASDTAWKDALEIYGKNPTAHNELYQYPFVQLYNLDTDPAESNNLAKDQPERVHRMINEVKQLITNGHSHGDSQPHTESRQIPLFRYVPRSLNLNR